MPHTVDPHMGLLFFSHISAGYIFFSQVLALQAATCCLVINHQRINIAFWAAGWRYFGGGIPLLGEEEARRGRESDFSGYLQRVERKRIFSGFQVGLRDF